jgi:pSer/pThr/pTyr-binding forkhead associated (FHA) protein
MPEPAWGGRTAPERSNGKSHFHATPETVRTPYASLQSRYSLVVLQGPLQGHQFVLNTFPARIGRGTEVEIALDADLNVSRRHAEIYEWNGTLRIRDLGSLHGTRVNSEQANDQVLIPGDRINLGETVLILRELP